MDISSEEVRRLQFSGTEYSYDGAEVEEFRRRVLETLTSYETASTAAAAPTSAAENTGIESEGLAAAQRVRQQSVQLAERMLRDVMGTSGDAVGGLEVWQDAAIMRALAEEEMEFAREESRRLAEIAAAKHTAMRAKYVKERAEVRAELQHELQSSRAAAGAEADRLRTEAQAQANEILGEARRRFEESRDEATSEAHRMERRLAVLHTALADAESRFRRLAAMAANEIGTLAAIADNDVESPQPDQAELHLASVDLTEEALSGVENTRSEDQHDADRTIARDPEVGFYQRRLAGLRDRLEKSGHPPE